MNLKPNYSRFISEIDEKSIEYLIHFTPTLNLYSILEQKNNEQVNVGEIGY